ncbi:MAG: 3-ketoacyl-ACP reductase [Eubacteriales bacterium]
MKNHRKTALVTGAARGIGRGISLTLARAGYTVCAVGTRPAEDENVRGYLAELTALSPESFYLSGDISNGEDRAHLVEEAFAGLGELDALVNNAGVAPLVRNDLLEMTEESFDRVLNINLRGTFFLTQAVAARMAAQPPASDFRRVIVFITSISAAVSSINRGEYCISKAGLSMAARLYADRLAGSGINVYEVRPGIIATDMTAGVMQKYQTLIDGGLCPIARIGQPEDVGRVVQALCDGCLPYSTGEILHVDGGMAIQRL